MLRFPHGKRRNRREGGETTDTDGAEDDPKPPARKTGKRGRPPKAAAAAKADGDAGDDEVPFQRDSLHPGSKWAGVFAYARSNPGFSMVRHARRQADGGEGWGGGGGRVPDHWGQVVPCRPFTFRGSCPQTLRSISGERPPISYGPGPPLLLSLTIGPLCS